MNRLKSFLAIAVICALLVACNTIHGAGEDISSGGEAISHAASTVQKKM